jgi:hypothetical protein
MCRVVGHMLDCGNRPLHNMIVVTCFTCFEKERVITSFTDQGLVPILPKVTNIVLDTFYIFVTFNQYSLVGQHFSQSFLRILVK